MPLVSMKRTASEIREQEPVHSIEDDKFPWGLSIHLGEDEIEKLGIAMPKAGDRMALQAVAKVTSTSESSSEDQKVMRSISLIITDLDLSPAGDDKSAAEVLFGKS